MLFVLAPWGFAKLWEALGGIGSLWEALEGFAGFARSCEALVGFEKLREAVGCFVRLWTALPCSGRGMSCFHDVCSQVYEVLIKMHACNKSFVSFRSLCSLRLCQG